jgi:N4-(beta-N-acetylglucosaminyl)-L-asparaginase
VIPDPRKSCGPYSSSELVDRDEEKRFMTSHDTIGMVVIANVSGRVHVAAGTSTNGANHKIPGRVGDGPIAGSGAYADSLVGGCGATGDGDVMMRFLPCYQAIESLRQGVGIQEAANDALRRIGKYFPSFKGAIVLADIDGNIVGASWGWTFTFSYRNPSTLKTIIQTVKPINQMDNVE